MSRLQILKLVFFPILLTIIGEFLLKHMMSRVVEQSWQLFVHPLVFLAFIAIVLGGLLWLYAMSQLSLSFMYPFMSLNYIVIIFGADFGLNESVTWHRYLAVILITIGLILISRSPNAEIKK